MSLWPWRRATRLTAVNKAIVVFQEQVARRRAALLAQLRFPSGKERIWVCEMVRGWDGVVVYGTIKR